MQWLASLLFIDLKNKNETFTKTKLYNSDGLIYDVNKSNNKENLHHSAALPFPLKLSLN